LRRRARNEFLTILKMTTTRKFGSDERTWLRSWNNFLAAGWRQSQLRREARPELARGRPHRIQATAQRVLPAYATWCEWGGNDDKDVGVTADGDDAYGIGDTNVFHLDDPDISTS
jgi:hypothetical protein